MNLSKISKHIITFIFIIGIINITGCKNNSDSNSLNQKEQELKLKEKELQLKENEMLDKKEAELNAKEKELEISNNSSQIDNRKTKINLNGSYSGSIKDGTKWYVFIKNFDGFNFKGYNDIYWKKSPEGFKTNFSGTFDASTNEIIMSEDRTAKGSGKFEGKVSIDGNSMSGAWHRYSDGNSFIWNLNKIEE